MPRCPICAHENPKTAARCDKCKAWLVQSAELPPTGAAAHEAEPGIDEALATQLMELVRVGRKIEAIKVVRERTGWGLADAKDAVEALEEGRQVSRFDETPKPPLSIGDAEILELVRGGNLIGAIKLHRERTGDGLRDAKLAVETLARQHGVPVAQGAGCGAAALMMAVGGAATLLLAAYAVAANLGLNLWLN